MTARGGQNLLQGAVRIASGPGRSHAKRLDALLRYLARALELSSASLFLPHRDLPVLTRRYSTIAPSGETSCHIPFDAGCVGRCAATGQQIRCTSTQLHPHELPLSDETERLALPLRQGGNLGAVLCVGSHAPLPAAAATAVKGILPVFATVVREAELARSSEERERHLALIGELARLQSIPLPPAKLIPRVLRLCTGSGLAAGAVVRVSEAGCAPSCRMFKSFAPKERGDAAARLALEEELSARVRQQEEQPLATPPGTLCLPLRIGQRNLGTFTLFGEELDTPQRREHAETVARLLSCALAEAISSERIESFCTENDKKLKELALLYRMSNTMLSTIKLNKLIHLTLTALTSGATPFFDRAMLYLANERSGVLQGMLGVTRETSPPLPVTPSGGDILASRWDISEEDMVAQRESDFSKEVRGRRLNLDRSHNSASRSVLEKRLIHIHGVNDPGNPGSAHAVAPLIAHEKVVGAVIVDNALTGAVITTEDLRFLQLFTNQAGMAIENSILYNRVADTNRQLFETQEHLLQKERLAALGEMAAGIAHELKNPLVSIGGFAGRLTRKLPADSPERGDAELIMREVLRLETILSDILFYSKKGRTSHVRCCINDIVRESLSVVGPTVEQYGIELSTRFSRQRLNLMGDAPQLKQVFINILANALDAMHQGGKLRVRLTSAELEGKDAVSVRVSDTGGGVPLEALHTIFTPFYTTKEKGTGLGLPIANRIVINHGGKIQVNNKPGVGAEFNVILPLVH